jgi:hypothetical protein
VFTVCLSFVIFMASDIMTSYSQLLNPCGNKHKKLFNGSLCAVELESGTKAYTSAKLVKNIGTKLVFSSFSRYIASLGLNTQSG